VVKLKFEAFSDVGLVVEREGVEFVVVYLDQVLEVDFTEAKEKGAVGSGCWIGLFTNFDKKLVFLVWVLSFIAPVCNGSTQSQSAAYTQSSSELWVYLPVTARGLSPQTYGKRHIRL